MAARLPSRVFASLSAFLVLFCPAVRTAAEEIVLLVDDVPAHGLVVAPVDLTSAVEWCGIRSVQPAAIQASLVGDGEPVPLQFVPSADFDAEKRIAGTVVLRLPTPDAAAVRLRFNALEEQAAEPWDGVARTSFYEVVHDARVSGGLPSRVVFKATSRPLTSLRWQDRMYHAEQGAWRFADDPNPQVERIAQGPLCTVVQVAGRYVRADGTQHAAQPSAVYQWFYFHDQPLVYVTVVQCQQDAFAWQEVHFLELHQSGDELPRWAGGEPREEGEFRGTQQSRRFPAWAAMLDGEHALAILRSGEMLVYDGKGGYGPYLHAHGSLAWSAWSGRQRELAAWMWIASQATPLDSIRNAAAQLPDRARVTASVDRVRSRIDELAIQSGKRSGDAGREARRRLAVARRLDAQGHFDQALQAADGGLPDGWQTLSAGDLELLLERTADGIRVVQLSDSATGIQLMAPRALPLFSLSLRHAETREMIQLTADALWKESTIMATGEREIQLDWRGYQQEGLEPLHVSAAAVADPQANAIRWTLSVGTPKDSWCLRRVVFPQLAVAELGDRAEVLFPRAAGEVQPGLWQRTFRYAGTYPSGWTSMQLLAAYDPSQRTGLYVGMHDPLAATKDILVESRPTDHAVVFAFDHPPAHLDQPGNDFRLPGRAVWQLLRGDWFDAAIIYRDWASREARWWPDLTAEGREDTPCWMRELPVWALASGSPEAVVPQVKRFAEVMGVPVGVHWYNWHQIPFDNDYPHYFPTKEGFSAAVAELQQSDIHVMPYINGRLWDSRDRGSEDFEFGSVARPAATKDENGAPYLERYGSKEADGSPVALGVMCPTTEVWQNKVSEIVRRLMNQCGVRGVYIDQVAAAKPLLCFDPAHDHPAGGGTWWPEAYWRMIRGIRTEMPPDRMLTTECNAEPYVHVFDGYLTWHWQYDGQVPVFPAVYGGAIQMFGRAYRGGPTKDLALRMKAGQQLVFGEQIGWISPSVVNEAENVEFLRQLVRLRWQLKRYFHAGRMARPPKLTGAIARVTADWQWHGQWPVTTDALMAGAWSLPAAVSGSPASRDSAARIAGAKRSGAPDEAARKSPTGNGSSRPRLVLLFVNVSDEPISVTVDFDAAQYGLRGEALQATELTAAGLGESWQAPRVFQRPLTLPPRQARAWELWTE
jgi:hypothetical protein